MTDHGVRIISVSTLIRSVYYCSHNRHLPAVVYVLKVQTDIENGLLI